MSPLLFLIGIMLIGTVTFGMVYAYQSLFVPRSIVRSRVAPGRGLGLSAQGGLRTDIEARMPLLRRLPLSRESREGMQRDLERAGADLRVNEYLAVRLGAASLGGLAGGVFAATVFGSNPLILAPFVAVPVVAGWGLPWLVLERRHRKRAARIEEQMPDALLALSKSLRAGTGLMGALAYAAEETSDPLGSELRATMRDIQLGRDVGDSFSALGARVENADLDIAVTAILIQRAVGGNLSEILANVSETVRERFELRREIAVITARQRLTVIATACLPPLVALVFISINPDVGRNLFETNAGRIALAIGLGFETLGIGLSRVLGRVEV